MHNIIIEKDEYEESQVVQSFNFAGLGNGGINGTALQRHHTTKMIDGTFQAAYGLSNWNQHNLDWL